MSNRWFLLLVVASACSSVRAERDGDLTKVPTPAPFVPTTKGESVLDVPDGYTATPFARGLALPSGICFDDRGNVYVLEAGGFLGANPGRIPPRIVKLTSDGKEAGVIELRIDKEPIAFPASGIVWHEGAFFISHRDREHAGCISKVSLDGTVTPIVTGLPSQGDHGTNQLAIKDGKIYFGQGTATNSGVVGLDDFVAFGWPQLHPMIHDVPARTVVLTGKNFLTGDPRGAIPGMKTVTGAFKPFGVPCERGEGVPGDVKCNGAILRCDLEGKNLEVHAWGLRNPFGIGFTPDGRLLVTAQGLDLRGSRPIAKDRDALLSIRKDAWYGWPDFTTDLRPLLGDDDHAPPGDLLGKRPEPLIDLTRSDVATPDRRDVVATFDVHASACGFAIAPKEWGKDAGKIFVAEFGTIAPATDPTKAVRSPGCRIVTVDDEGRVRDFLKNERDGPASRSVAMGRGLERPLDVRFGPDGALYIVDYGVVAIDVDPAVGISVLVRDGTGTIWRVTPDDKVAH